MATHRRHTFLERLRRVLHYRLVIPLKRSRHPPEHSAMGVAVGLFWAFTPLVGIQMYLCLMTWLPFRYFKRLDFSLIIAFAWTWVSNVFTMFPLYYGFYVTGQVMMGHWEDLSGYHAFVANWDAVFLADVGFWESLVQFTTLVARDQGLSMLIGCLPWAIGFGWLGYVWSLRFVRHRREERRRRLQLKADSHL